jgi:uncharacterized membrane protein YqiK
MELLAHLPLALQIAIPAGALALLLFVVYNCVAIAGGDELITLERRWFGAQMPDGRTVALSHEVGVQARTLGPGFHFLIPFIYKTQKHRFVVIGTDQIGLVRACNGASIPSGEFFAKPVECSLFQDGEAFLRNGGEKERNTGIARADVILAQGEATAKSYKMSVDAMGAVFGQLKIVEQIAANHIKLIPDVLIAGGGKGGGSNIESLLGLALIEKLTGKDMKSLAPVEPQPKK